VNRTVRIMLAAMLCIALVAGLAACSPTSTTPGTPGSTGTTGTPSTPAAGTKIRIGTLPVEDALPLWVAERDSLFQKAGIDVSITVFQSAQERDAAFTAGAIDGFMGDMIAATNLRAAGVPVKVTTVMLGAKASEGRFGIVVKPGSKITSVKGLAGVPVGTSSATIQEYVLDKLMEAGGVAAADIKKEEVKKVPVRFELLMSGKLEAAALPEPFLSLAAKTGGKIIADDTKGANISQTVLVFGQKYLDDSANAALVGKLLGTWDTAVGTINADPASFRTLLVEKARLPKPLEADYAVNTYPTAQLPAEAEVQAVLDWMKAAGLLKTPVTYADLMWTAPAK
jgi:NitT/TauT family transport system substrate-binding protein